jgi:hypothetical protein
MLYAKNWGLSPPRYGQHMSHPNLLVAFNAHRTRTSKKVFQL